MNNSIKTLFTFITGAAVGSAVTWYFVKTKYEQIAQEEIDSVIEVYSKRASVEPEEASETPSLKKEAKDMINDLRYVSDDENEEKGGSEEMKNGKPYVILPDEFEYNDRDYEQISLTYYLDGVLADDISDDVIEDVENTVGLDFHNHFGEWEEDTVYIRNDRLKCDYEINRDNRSYTEVTGFDLNPTDDDE